MAEALFYLSEELAWAPTSAPRGELVLIRDAVESSGSFLVQHFAALFLKAGACVCAVHWHFGGDGGLPRLTSTRAAPMLRDSACVR